MTKGEVIVSIICVAVIIMAIISSIEDVRLAKIKSKAQPKLIEIKVKSEHIYRILAEMEYMVPSEVQTLLLEVINLCESEEEE